MGLLDTRGALLQALVTGESYGLELIERVSEDTQGLLILRQGRVYPVLRQLEEEGLVTSSEGEPSAEKGGRPRRYYRLTAKGVAVAEVQAQAVFGLFKMARKGG